MIRLLCIVGAMNAGGAETFLMKMYRTIDKNLYQMDFAVAEEKAGVYDEEIRQMGGKIYHIIPKTKGPIKSFLSIKNIVSDNHYKYVMRVSQHSLSGIELIAAKCGGAKKVIFRSSNTQTCGNKLNQYLHKVFLPITKIVPDIKIAPSTEAAEFMFGKGCVEKGDAKILPNALVIEDFKFNSLERNEIRRELGVEDKFVVGHVGRFSNQKNHNFVIDVFNEISRMRSDAVLVLIGDGELRKEIEDKVKILGLEDKVLMLGVRDDVAKILNGLDLFLFPSFFEGMPNTVIEAQTNGLPCVISTAITPEVKITKCIKMLSLHRSAKEWAQMCVKIYTDSKTSNREKYAAQMSREGYNIETSTRKFLRCIEG